MEGCSERDPDRSLVEITVRVREYRSRVRKSRGDGVIQVGNDNEERTGGWVTSTDIWVCTEVVSPDRVEHDGSGTGK